LFTDPVNAAALAKSVGQEKSLTGYLRAHLNRLAVEIILPCWLSFK